MSKKEKRLDLDVRPKGPFFNNYDYAGPDKPSKISPGKGIYNGKMNRYKSVSDFIRKRKRKMRIEAMMALLGVNGNSANILESKQVSEKRLKK